MQPSDIELVDIELEALYNKVGICANCPHLTRYYKTSDGRLIEGCAYSYHPEPIYGFVIFCRDFCKLPLFSE